MRRTFRILFASAAALSALLCLAMAVLWVRSYFGRGDEGVVGYWGYRLHPTYTHYYDAWEADALNARGRWTVAVFGPDRPRGRRFDVRQLEPDRQSLVGYYLDPPKGAGATAGVRYVWQPQWRVISAPHAHLVGVLAILPGTAWVARAARRRRLRLRGVGALCTECGYDLRATPGRCPECGAVPTVVTA
jgi:hypothetical protein